jgi:hypothetical protein
MTNSRGFPRLTSLSLAALIALLSCHATDSAARSINDAVGKTSFTWLRAVSDAGISAAGECMAARDGAAGTLVHPAAVAGIEQGLAKMSYVAHYADTQYGSLGYAGRFHGRDMAIRVAYVNYGEFIRTDNLGERLGMFTAGDIGISLTMARKLRDDFKVGGTVSYLSSKIEEFTAQAVSADFGMLYYPPFENLVVGAMLSNIGTVLKSYSSGYEESFPIVLSVGARKGLAHAPVTLMADVLFPSDSDVTYAFGAEANIGDTLFLYAGTKSRSTIDVNTMRAETDYSAITTFGFGLIIKRYRFNYAYCPDDVIEDVHKITLGLSVF